MKWFEGDITAAVNKSKSNKAIFVVFVEGTNDVSQSLTQALDSTEVSAQLESDKFVAIKIQSDSNEYKFFAEIYKVVPIPSIFFIGETGRPLEIVSNALSTPELASKIGSISAKANPQTNTSSVDAEQKVHSSSNKTTPMTSNVDQTSENSHVSNTTNNSEATAEAAVESQSTQEETIKDMARAKQLIDLQNKKRLEEEERKEREREIERRKMGKDAQKWRKQQHDRQYLEAHEERMKEKAADAAAREKILKQIAEDKLERKRKFEMSMQETNAKKQNKTPEVAPVVQATGRGDLSKARIQFKSPDGNILTGTFEATSTLDTLRQYVIQNANLPFRQFSMSAFFPRRDFTLNDNDKTLLELELVPSSVILIMPSKSNNQGAVKKSNDGGNIFSFFLWTLLAPVISVYNYVVGYFRGRPAGGGNDNENESRTEGSTRLGNLNIDLGQFSNLRARRLSGSQRPAKIKTRGNIHTLHSGDNDNDENNTWNGNSTQQM